MPSSSRKAGTRQLDGKPHRAGVLWPALAKLALVAVVHDACWVCKLHTKPVTLSRVHAQSMAGLVLAVPVVLGTSVPVHGLGPLEVPSGEPFQQMRVKSNPAAPPPTLVSWPAAYAASRPYRPSCRGKLEASSTLLWPHDTMSLPL